MPRKIVNKTTYKNINAMQNEDLLFVLVKSTFPGISPKRKSNTYIEQHRHCKILGCALTFSGIQVCKHALKISLSVLKTESQQNKLSIKKHGRGAAAHCGICSAPCVDQRHVTIDILTNTWVVKSCLNSIR